MKDRKKKLFVVVAFILLFGIGLCYLFLKGREPDTEQAASDTQPNTEQATGNIQQVPGNTEQATGNTQQVPGNTEQATGNTQSNTEQASTDTQPDTEQASVDIHPGKSALGYVTEGTEKYRDFVIDNVFHSATEGDIHYNVYIPESYDGREPYALYFTLPGYEGLYFQGVASNLQSEEFGFEAQKYNEKMIIVAPQLSDWGETSANQTIALVEYFLEAYNIDKSKVYGNGFSGGGETMSQVMGKRPDLFTAYLQVSSQWDGAYEPVVEQRLPVYFAIGENDEYYGSDPSREAYDTLHDLYVQQGLSEAEIDELLVLDVKEHAYFTDRGMSNEHGGGGLFAYDEEIMGWLFQNR